MSNNPPEEKSSHGFSLPFQEHMLASILFDEKFLQQHIDDLSPDQFTDEVLRGIAGAGLNFFRKEKEAPSREAILEIVKHNTAPGREYQEYVEALESINEKIGVNTKHFQSRVMEFVQLQALTQALRVSSVLLETGEIEKIAGIVTKAAGMGLNGHSKIYDYLEAVRERALEYQKQSQEKDPDRLSTGYAELDAHMEGGLSKGELGLVIADPKGGKTTMLINLAANCLMQNKNVGYVTLELSKKKISAKLDSRFFGHALAQIKKTPKSFHTAIEVLRKKLTSKLFIYEYPTKSIGVEKLAGLIEKDKLDVLFVDYGQLLKPNKDRGDRRHEITDSYEGMRRIAGETQVPIWTAHQANRPATGAKIIQRQHIAEDYNVLAIVDFALSLNQTDEERRSNDLRLYVVASRIGESQVLMNFKTNWTTSTIQPAFQEEELQ